MKKILIFTLIIASALIAAMLVMHRWTSSSNIDGNHAMNSSLTVIQLGDPKKTNLNGAGSSQDRHPSGITFYQQEWARGNLGAVEFTTGKHDFVVDNVLSVIGSADADASDGIFEWTISFGVSPEQADTHEAALARMMKLFSDLRARGWARYIDSDDPRLTGKEAWNYIATNSVYSLDSSYLPTIDEWKAVSRKMPHWRFYADGVYLDVSMTESNMGGFVGKTTYLLTISARSEYAFYGIGYFSGNEEEIRNWKTLLPAELQRYHAKRLATEAALKDQGYTIDTAYQDPPIRALK